MQSKYIFLICSNSISYKLRDLVENYPKNFKLFKKENLNYLLFWEIALASKYSLEWFL